MGLDVEFLLHHQLRRHIVEAIIEHRKLITEATNRKVSNEEWRPLNLQTATVSFGIERTRGIMGLLIFRMAKNLKQTIFLRRF